MVLQWNEIVGLVKLIKKWRMTVTLTIISQQFVQLWFFYIIYCLLRILLVSNIFSYFEQLFQADWWWKKKQLII